MNKKPLKSRPLTEAPPAKEAKVLGPLVQAAAPLLFWLRQQPPGTGVTLSATSITISTGHITLEILPIGTSPKDVKKDGQKVATKKAAK